MNIMLKSWHPDSECHCYNEFGMDEEFLCEICLSRLKQVRRKVKRQLRRESKAKYKNNFEC